MYLLHVYLIHGFNTLDRDDTSSISLYEDTSVVEITLTEVSRSNLINNYLLSAKVIARVNRNTESTTKCVSFSECYLSRSILLSSAFSACYIFTL